MLLISYNASTLKSVLSLKDLQRDFLPEEDKKGKMHL